MPAVIYIQHDGQSKSVDVPVGDSVMDGALDSGISGIIGQCGGGCTCSTCHCYVDETWVSALPEPIADELELLDYALERQRNSRLACQIMVTDALDGLKIRIPIRQT